MTYMYVLFGLVLSGIKIVPLIGDSALVASVHKGYSKEQLVLEQQMIMVPSFSMFIIIWRTKSLDENPVLLFVFE